jgi:hypothetical protein
MVKVPDTERRAALVTTKDAICLANGKKDVIRLANGKKDVIRLANGKNDTRTAARMSNVWAVTSFYSSYI